MNFPDDETGQILAEMQQAGIDLNVSHDVVFFHLFEKETNAQAMVDYIKENMKDVTVNMHPDETPNVWDVDCTLQLVPSYDAVVKQETEFEALATKFSGYNDGWGVEA
ncbi:ribonuclease E inhibitor RraB [Colwellia sp. 20A7]|uniref:ribonuclease E inhibitor RraB n=1 Tax=Colwellia sp. 20A7 TaxID=2689569 RepID=UPI00135C5F61|nr:ribonuclease E inhibitor RraB [Colwellia sp. 20A7]